MCVRDAGGPAGHTHTHARAHARVHTHTHTHTHTHACMHACTHMHKHTHTHTHTSHTCFIKRSSLFFITTVRDRKSVGGGAVGKEGMRASAFLMSAQMSKSPQKCQKMPKMTSTLLPGYRDKRDLVFEQKRPTITSRPTHKCQKDLLLPHIRRSICILRPLRSLPGYRIKEA